MPNNSTPDAASGRKKQIVLTYEPGTQNIGIQAKDDAIRIIGVLALAQGVLINNIVNQGQQTKGLIIPVSLPMITVDLAGFDGWSFALGVTLGVIASFGFMVWIGRKRGDAG